MLPDYYAILGIPKNASGEEIRRAYHKLAKLYHPDVYRGSGGDIKFKLLNEAYTHLIHPDKRRKYDFKLKYGAIIESDSRAEDVRKRRAYAGDEIHRRRREEARRENLNQRKRFRIFDKFMFWSLFFLAIMGLIYGIIDAIINLRFGGVLISLIITVVLIFGYYTTMARK